MIFIFIFCLITTCLSFIIIYNNFYNKKEKDFKSNNNEVIELKNQLSTQVVIINDEIALLNKECTKWKKDIKVLVSDFVKSYQNDININFWESITEFNVIINELCMLWINFKKSKLNLDLQNGNYITYECDKCHNSCNSDIPSNLMDIFWFLVSQHIFVMQKLVIAKKFKSKKNNDSLFELKDFEKNWLSLIWTIEMIAKIHRTFIFSEDNRILGKISYCDKCLENNSKFHELFSQMGISEEINMQVVT